MEQIKMLLEARKEYLLQVEKEKEEALRSAPEGALRICSRKNKAQYYYRTNPKDFSGVYMSEKEMPLIKGLAQKAYDKKVADSVGKELKAISGYLSGCPEVQAEQVYEKVHKERKKLVTPIRKTDEQYVADWEAVQYYGKEFEEETPEIYTAKGEKVRSKSEVIIADMLGREGIPYRYECPLKIKGVGTFYPDFTVLNVRERKEIYWEHFGMMDDAAYVEYALSKLSVYTQSGIICKDNLIVTYETKKNPLNQKTIKLMIENYLS